MEIGPEVEKIPQGYIVRCGVGFSGWTGTARMFVDVGVFSEEMKSQLFQFLTEISDCVGETNSGKAAELLGRYVEWPVRIEDGKAAYLTCFNIIYSNGNGNKFRMVEVEGGQ